MNIFHFFKKTIPKLSNTEYIALRSGSASLDKSIFQGILKLPKKPTSNKYLPNNYVEQLLNAYDGTAMYPNNNDNIWIKILAKRKFFSFLINEKYGGIKLSVNELSNVLTKITSVDPAMGVVAMVPNSLGPGELLIKYGTEKQKDYYLPKLANGTFIPCFGLTGPNNGSDATGNIDKGTIALDQNGNRVIRVSINKRYITLAPVANLMGIAFNLEDPDGLLTIGEPGVTVALIERNTCGLIQDTHHNPLNVGFPNGTLKGDLTIPVENIIGGESNAGNGWKMLMECLSAGRGVSLPATANASSKVASYGIYHYIQIREQFKMPLAKMEAIQEKFNTMIYHTWVIQSSVSLTNDLLDSGENPAVISAIMKQQCTERGRIVLNEAMDIHAGASICIGPNNFLEKFYRSAPIGITVEGSNTLTRSLIIFGQGLNKSHPYIFPVLETILNNDEKNFYPAFRQIVGHSIKSLLQAVFTSEVGLNRQLLTFACLANFVALRGGGIKKQQMLSGDMADVFSNLYLATSVRYADEHNPVSEKLTKYVIDRLVCENQHKINKIIDNLTLFERCILWRLRMTPRVASYAEESSVFQEIMSNPKIMTSIKENIHVTGILRTMEKYIENGGSDDTLKDEIINVGEYKNQH